MAATDCYCHCPCDGSCCCSAHGTAFQHDANDDGCCDADVAVRAAAAAVDVVGVAHAHDANDDDDEGVRYAVVAAAAVGLRNDDADAVAAVAHDDAAVADACGLADNLAVVSILGRACCFAGEIWRRRSNYHRREKLLPGYW